MKLVFSCLLAVLFLDASRCNPNRDADCIDPSKIDSNAVCTMDYRPVCGCDGKTYSNACVAEHSGVTKWEEGACPEAK